MNRRTFLTQITRGALAGAAVFTLPGIQASTYFSSSAFIKADVLGKTLKGTRDGRLFESVDQGKTWLPTANFGSHCSIVSILERQGRIFTVIGIQRFTFYLASIDGREWRTVDTIPAA